ncbi:AAA family ATPase [Spirosoma sp. KUDC1026]|uniref:AAA family ATPase n=1 Tax=Spirosoma sp. KUDC1026 TaxID=2745947 RepID=UPI00159BD03E|nr:ATP-binding protein [Spirosoma sp. KUDC1026]QKZ11264.1 AAA family ATPase [Spirosoma sp. KUDC1026]
MLKRVSIQNFKSLKDVTLDLQKVNLLIGPNNSGKTNFLKALEYFGKNYNNFPRTEDRSLTFNRNGLPIYYHLIDDSEDAVHIKKGFDFRSGDIIDFSIYNSKIKNIGSGTVFDIAGEKELQTLITGANIYKPDPNKLTQPGPVGIGEEMVNSDVSNLVGFLDIMLSKYRRTVFNQIETDLHNCISEFDEIKLEDALYITDEQKRKFKENSFKRIGLGNSEKNVSFWADELSEGTLYFLALLSIVNQPKPPKLLLLEEPEKGIHPRRIREVMDLIFRLAEEKDVQIILTTHNEHVLDDFTTRPEAVFVFDKNEDGATCVKNLQRNIIEPFNEYNQSIGLDDIDLTSNLSENWIYGLLGGVPSIP